MLVLALLLLQSVSASADTLSWDQALSEARENNPALRAASFSYDASDYNEQGAHSNYLPQVNGSLSYGHSSYGSTDISQGQSGDSYNMALTASQNIFNGLADQGKVDQAKAQKKISHANFDSVNAQISYDLKSAFAGMRYAQDYEKLAQQIVTRRQDNLSLVDLRFDHGSENKGSVLLSKANLEQAKLEAMQAKNALVTARAELARVLGRDDGEGLIVSGSVPTTSPAAETSVRSLASLTPTYLSSQASEENADAGVVVARSGFFPTLGVTGSTGKTGDGFLPQQKNWSVGATLTVPIFSGGSTYYALKSAAKSQAAAAKTKEDTRRTENSKLTQMFSAYQVAVQKLEVDKTYAEAASVRSTIGRARYNNGLLIFDDWDTIENDLINRQKNLIASERDRITAEAAWEQAQGKGAIHE